MPKIIPDSAWKDLGEAIGTRQSTSQPRASGSHAYTKRGQKKLKKAGKLGRKILELELEATSLGVSGAKKAALVREIGKLARQKTKLENEALEGYETTDDGTSYVPEAVDKAAQRVGSVTEKIRRKLYD